MPRDRGYQYNYEPAREVGIQPTAAQRRQYDGPIQYGAAPEEPSPTSSAAYYPQTPAGFVPLTVGYPLPNLAIPVPGMIPGMMQMPSPGGMMAPPPWYNGGMPTPGGASPHAAFAPYGAKPGGVKTTHSDDRPPALMINPTVAGDKATFHLHLQCRWDLRTKPTPDNVTTITGQPPDLSQPATNPPVRAMFIVAEDLPWAISIKQYNVITCQNLLDAIYKTLQESIKRDEFFCAPVKKRGQITKVALEESGDPSQNRHPITNEAGDIARPADPRRVDWVGALTDFRGLYINEKLLEERCTWAIDDLQDAWVMELGLNADD